MSKSICIKFIVSGKVQGVWFRDSTQKQAVKLNLTGWVKNLVNGDVEVLACGDEEALKQLEQWLWQGSMLAEVENIIINKLSYEERTKFEILV